MNRRELQSDQPIHVPLLRVLSLPPSACIVAIAGRRAPHLATTSRATPAATVLSCAATRIHRDDHCITRTEYEAVQAATRSADRQGTAYLGARIVWGDAVVPARPSRAVAVRAGAAELASFVCRSSSDMTCSDYASVIELRCQVS